MKELLTGGSGLVGSNILGDFPQEKIVVPPQMARIIRYYIQNTPVKVGRTFLMNLSCLFISKKHFMDIMGDDIYYYFDLTQWIDKNLFFFGHYERDEIEFVRRYLNKNSLFFDIGANSGIYSLLASKICSRVFSFEPDKVNRRRLQKNVLLNKINNIKIIPHAVSDKNGVCRMYINSSNRGMNSLFNLDNTSNYLVVKTQTLDQIVDKLKIRKISLIKMDIEGSEFNALRGAIKTIKRFKPAFLIEVNRRYDVISGYKTQDIYDFFNSLDYRPYSIGVDKRRKINREHFLKIKQQNVFFEYLKNKNV